MCFPALPAVSESARSKIFIFNVLDMESMKLSEEERYRKAAERVKEEKGFYTHLFSYLVVNTFIIIIDALTSHDNWWFYWPLLGWGIGLVMHGLTVFGSVFGKDWEEKRIQKYMDKE